MRTIFCRELKAYFYTPLGYVFVGVFWVLGAAFFYFYNIQAGTSDLTALFGNLSYLLMLIVPLLTMRLLSEEKRLKTDQLLLCTPTPVASIVLGKFCAAMFVLLVSLLGTLLYVAILCRYTVMSLGMVAGCYLGFALLGAAYISVGVLMSALTENQLTAAVLTLAANMLLQLAEMAAGSTYIPYLGFVASVLKALQLNTRFARFSAGVFTPEDLAYFVLFAAVPLSLSLYVTKRRRLAGR